MTRRQLFTIACTLGWSCGDAAPTPTPGAMSTTGGGPPTSSGTPADSSGSAPEATTTGPAGTTETTAAADSTGSDSEGSSSTGEPPPSGLDFEPIEIDDPVVRATAIAFLPGSSDFLLVSKDGDIAHFTMRGDAAVRQGSFVLPDVYTSSDCGAISIAFDPEFDDNRLLYVGLCKSRYFSGIFRMELSADYDYDAVVPSMAEVIEVGHPMAANPWHNVGSIGFDDAGNLWAVFGDKTVPTSAQDLSDNLGALIRIVPDRSVGGSGYEPAPDNPYYGDPDRSWDIWSYGLRSPWKAVQDAQGRFFVNDVGSDHHEEVNVIAAADRNYGWPEHEGACDAEDCSAFVDPVATWPHAPHPYINDDVDAAPVNSRVSWVGAAYRDLGNDRYGGLLTDRVLFGDSCLGYVRAIEVDDTGAVVFDEHLAHLIAPTSWAQAPDGYLYVITYGGCGAGSIDNDDPPRVQMYRAVPSR